MCFWRVKSKSEDHFPHQNWPIILALQVVISTAYSVFTPSIYQFITTPRSAPQEQSQEEGSTRFWPGLGESETLYAWVLMAGALGEFVFFPVIGYMTENLPYIVTQLVASILCAVGGAVYALATEGWMVVLGKIIVGCASTFAVVVHSYIGEIGTKMDRVRKKKKKRPVKYILYIVFSVILNGGYVITFIVTSIMAQFPNVNPYRWPGWFLTALALVYAFVVLLLFKETRPFAWPKHCKTRSCARETKWSARLSSKWHIHLIAYSFVVSSGFVVGQHYAILYTLVTPVLSDQFGFDVANTAPYLIGVAVALLASSFIQLGAKLIRIDNRMLLGLSFIMGLVGSVLIGDWQAIGHDPCSLSNANDIQHLNKSINGSDFPDADYGQSGIPSTPSMASGLNNAFDTMYYSGDSPLEISDNVTSNSNQTLLERCEALSSSGHQCFWNPNSRITGEFCNTCHASCQSEQKSSNFYQFSIGVLLVALSSSLGFVFVSAITSGYTPVESQGTVLSLVLGFGTLSRAVSPLWFVETYELTGKHTYLPMAINAGCVVILLLLLAVLYKELAPRSAPSEKSSVYHVNATFDATENDKSDTFLKSVQSWMEESANNVSTFLPNNSKAGFKDGSAQEFSTLPSLHEPEVAFVIGEQK